jgi:hypothetical protein
VSVRIRIRGMEGGGQVQPCSCFEVQFMSEGQISRR